METEGPKNSVQVVMSKYIICGPPNELLSRLELHLEDESAVARDIRCSALGAVGQRRRNGKAAFPSNFHSGDAQVPALDHFPAAQSEFERLTLDALVELLVVLLQLTCIVDSNLYCKTNHI